MEKPMMAFICVSVAFMGYYMFDRWNAHPRTKPVLLFLVALCSAGAALLNLRFETTWFLILPAMSIVLVSAMLLSDARRTGTRKWILHMALAFGYIALLTIFTQNDVFSKYQVWINPFGAIVAALCMLPLGRYLEEKEFIKVLMIPVLVCLLLLWDRSFFYKRSLEVISEMYRDAGGLFLLAGVWAFLLGWKEEHFHESIFPSAMLHICIIMILLNIAASTGHLETSVSGNLFW